LFKSFNSQLQIVLNKELYKKKDGYLDISHFMTGKNTDFITFGFEKAIVSGNWSIKRFHIERKGVSQLLNRISFISAIGMIGRLSSQFEKTRKIAGPRALLGSHWGMICPCDTPDG
jgi:DNA-directed RNA polymerase III subunit RPC2